MLLFSTSWPLRAEKFDNKFNILRNLELLRVVGANDRNHVVHLVTVGDGVGTDLADVNFQDAQGRQASHIAIMCIGSEERRHVLEDAAEGISQRFPRKKQ